jgi:arylsulfatase A-like enzyme
VPKPVVEMIDKPKSGSNWASGLLNALMLCAACAGIFFYAELIESAHDPYWAGGTVDDWIEAAQALGLYAGVIAVVSLLPYCLLSLLIKPATGRAVLSVVLPVAVAGGVWFLIDSTTEELPFLFKRGVPVALLTLLGLTTLLGVARIAKPAVTASVALLGIVGAIATMYVSAITNLMADDRGSQAALSSMVWLGVSMTGGLVILLLTVKAWPRWFVRVVSMAVLAALYPAALIAAPYASASLNDGEHKNVLLISVDTLRADYCSAYGGSVPTPNLEAIASEGVIFERHYALAPWTVPSLNGLMTSKYPPGLTPGASSEQRALEERSYQKIAAYWELNDGVTYFKKIGNLGYETAGVYANPTIQFQEWLTEGFQGRQSIDSTTAREPVRFKLTPVLRTVLADYRPAFAETRLIDSSAAVTEFGLKFLRQPRDAPFFLWLHFMDPHTPYDPPDRFRKGETPWRAFPPESALLSQDEEGQLSDADKAAARSLYEAEIRYVDDCIGRLLFALRQRGLDTSTLVCIVSDHGEEFWEHGKWGHGYEFYDEQVRVPLIFAGPGIMPSRMYEPVSSIDILPTISGWLGHGQNDEWHGSDLGPLLAGTDSAPLQRPVYSQAAHYFRYDPEPMRMVVDGNYKLIVGLESEQRRLFDLSDDPGETTNLADSLPDVVTRLQGLIDAWTATFPADFDDAASWQGEASAPAPDEDYEEALRALGYAE